MASAWRRRHPAVLSLLCVLGAIISLLTVLWVRRGPEEVSLDQVLREHAGLAGNGASLKGRPAAGVYSLQADGVETLSILNNSQRQGPTIPLVVTHDGDTCWNIRMDYSTNRWQDTRYCLEADRVMEIDSTGLQSFDFGALHLGDTTESICEQPSPVIDLHAEPGDQWVRTCHGHTIGQDTRQTSEGMTTFVGSETLEIGGVVVDALHYRYEAEVSGSATGTEDHHRWYAADTGMVLKGTSSVHISSPSPIGDVVFTEESQLELASLAPQTSPH
jgi:hypothetical protein